LWNEKDGNEDICIKTDPTRMSFIFTLKNPHNVPARMFALRSEEKDAAVARGSS
jgi:hypothetical protein